MKRLKWLDDLRDPKDSRMDWLTYSPIGKELEVSWLKYKREFVCWI